jgi:hypothetical protein
MKLYATLVPVVLALALGASACGGSPSAAAGGDPNKKRLDAALKWAQCMREHGANVPDPKVSADGGIMVGGAGPGGGAAPSRAVMERADKTCRHFMKDAGGANARPMSAADRQKLEQQALKFARCMRAHGVDMPDPTFGGSGGEFKVSVNAGKKGISPKSPNFQRAQKACGSLMGKGGFQVTGP